MLSLIIPKAGVPTHHLVVDTPYDLWLQLQTLSPPTGLREPLHFTLGGNTLVQKQSGSISKQTPANISKQESDPYPSSDKTGPGIQIFEMKTTSQTLQSPPHCYSDEETGMEQSPEGLLTLGPSCLQLTVQPYTTRCHLLSIQPQWFQATNCNGKDILKTKSDKQMPSGSSGIQPFAGSFPFRVDYRNSGTRGITCSYFPL